MIYLLIAILVIIAILVEFILTRSLADSPQGKKQLLALLVGFAMWDTGFLLALPRLDISFGPIQTTLVALAIVRLLLGVALSIPLKLVRRFKPSLPLTRLALATLAAANLVIIACQVDAFLIEPFDLRLTTLAYKGPGLSNGQPLRILHLSDLHIEYMTNRERDLLQRVKELQPDMIVFTGDYPNIDYRNDPETMRQARQALSQLHAPYGVYAVPGTAAVDIPSALAAIFDGLDNITLLQDEVRPVELPGGKIYLVGIKYVNYERDSQMLSELAGQVPPGAYTLLLYHTPDLIEDAAPLGINLYLAGHTHGGQIRLPFIGPLATSSRFGKKYYAGQHQVGNTILYVSRGIGMEGLGFPRARFLTPPEIEIISLQ